MSHWEAWRTVGPLPAGSPAFIDRSRRVQDVLRTVGGQGGSGLHIYGPRRSGKTTALLQLTDVAQRETVTALQGSVVVYSDMAPFAGDAVAGMRGICRRLAEETGAAISQEANLVVAVDAALRAIPRRLLVLIDNFEQIAPYLEREHQGIFRTAFYEKPAASCVVATKASLDECLEFFGDQKSDAKDVIVKQIALAPVVSAEIAEVLVQNGVLEESAHEWGEYVRTNVGGNVAWVKEAVVVIQSHVGLEQGPRQLSPQVLREVERRIADACEQPWTKAYQDLPHKLRRWLAWRTPGLDDGSTRDLRLRGWAEDGRICGRVLEEWLGGDRGEPVLPQAAGHYERLLRAAEKLNERAWDQKESWNDILQTTWLTKSAVQPFLRRPVRDRAMLQDLVTALHDALFKGTEGDSIRRRRLPACCYVDERSPLIRLSRGASAFASLAAGVIPEEQGRHLCDDVIRFVERLAATYPWEGDQVALADELFGAAEWLVVDEEQEIVSVLGEPLSIKGPQFRIVQELARRPGEPVLVAELVKLGYRFEDQLPGAMRDIRVKVTEFFKARPDELRHVADRIGCAASPAAVVKAVFPDGEQKAYRLGVSAGIARIGRRSGR